MSTQLHDVLSEGQDVAIGAATGIAAHAPEPSPTVIETDRWTRRAGARLAEQWREALAEDPSEPRFDDDESPTLTAEQLDKMADPNVAADAVATLLNTEPRLAEQPEDTHRAKWWKQLMENSETVALRGRTVASATLAEIAASELASEYARYVVAHPPKQDGEKGEGENGDDNESPEEAIARIRSTRGALKSAAQAADAAEAVGAGLGLGEGAQSDAGSVASYARRVKRSPNLAAIMRMAGRFIAKAERLQRQRSNLSGMEITGVELSGDVPRLLPLETAKIAGVVPELETLALLDLVESRALSYKRIRRVPQAQGPIVVSVDESGSMSGDRIAAAKGLALAMASIARQQKRPFMLVGWSNGDVVSHVRGEDGPEAIVEWLEHFWNGGTDLRGPLWTVTTELWPEGPIGAQADHIIITDDDVGLDPWLLDHYKAWTKGTNVRTFGIGIGVRRTQALAQFCDGGVWCLPELSLDNPAVDVVLSIGPTFTNA